MALLSRRQFLATGLVAGGGLALGTLLLRPGSLSGARDLAVRGNEVLLNLWVKLAPDGVATVFVPHTEMGQGVLTSLPMMLADEMDLSWDQVRVEQAPVGQPFANRDLARGYVFGDWDIPGPLVGAVDFASMKVAELMHLQITGGSTSVALTGRYGMRRAGAAARHVLVKAAADRWNVAPDTCRTDAGFVVHPDGAKRLGYGDLAAEAAAFDVPLAPTLKEPSAYHIVGTSVPRVDLAAKVDGSAVYGIDADLPDLRYAALLPVPTLGGAIIRVDATRALALPGVEHVIEIEGAVAVVADRYWRAQKALRDLDVEFEAGPHAEFSSAALRADHEQVLAADALEVDHEEGDVEAAEAGAERILDAQYAVPHLAHATMEPMNCTAWFHDGQCEIWSGVQNMLGARAFVAEQSGIPFEQVTIHPVMLGGGFGRRGTATTDYVGQAVEIAQQVPHPVKLVWSREDDIRHDAYRPALVSRMRMAVDGAGRPTTWQHDFVGKHEPVKATRIPYSIPNQRIRYGEDSSPVRFGPWRSVDHSQHSFFIESFIDEAAHAAGRDPLDFRLELLEAAPRHRAVLERLRAHAQWDTPLEAGRGRGVAVVECFGSVVAEVVEVTAGEDWLRVDRVVAVADTGEVIHPDSLRGQLESAVIFGLTAALFGEITLEKGAVVQSNFPDYEMVRMATAPEIESFLEPSGGALGGAGEIGTPPLAPALVNALFQATGRRVRELPLAKAGFRIAPRAAG